MSYTYQCPNNKCSRNNNHPHELSLPKELVLDEKNIAEMYCPRCNLKLKKIK